MPSQAYCRAFLSYRTHLRHSKCRMNPKKSHVHLEHKLTRKNKKKKKIKKNKVRNQKKQFHPAPFCNLKVSSSHNYKYRYLRFRNNRLQNKKSPLKDQMRFLKEPFIYDNLRIMLTQHRPRQCGHCCRWRRGRRCSSKCSTYPPLHRCSSEGYATKSCRRNWWQRGHS